MSWLIDRGKSDHQQSNTLQKFEKTEMIAGTVLTGVILGGEFEKNYKFCFFLL
jgi:hypothetical protein